MTRQNWKPFSKVSKKIMAFESYNVCMVSFLKTRIRFIYPPSEINEPNCFQTGLLLIKIILADFW